MILLALLMFIKMANVSSVASSHSSKSVTSSQPLSLTLPPAIDAETLFRMLNSSHSFACDNLYRFHKGTSLESRIRNMLRRQLPNILHSFDNYVAFFTKRQNSIVISNASRDDYLSSFIEALQPGGSYSIMFGVVFVSDSDHRLVEIRCNASLSSKASLLSQKCSENVLHTQSAAKWSNALKVVDSSAALSKKEHHLVKDCDSKLWQIVISRTLKDSTSQTYVTFCEFPLNHLKVEDACGDDLQVLFNTRHDCDESVSKCSSKSSSAEFAVASSFECCCLNDSQQCYSASDSALLCPTAVAQSGANRQLQSPLAIALLVVNVIASVMSFCVLSLVVSQRQVQDFGVRGWALCELMLIGAIFLYGMVIVEFTGVYTWSCCLVTWLREMGFALFYGAIILKVFRNLTEYRVRRAHHVLVREKDMLKLLAAIVLVTLTGLLAWTITSLQFSQLDGHVIVDATAGCRVTWWHYSWYLYESLCLLYGLSLCYKARSTDWAEKRQFTAAILVELTVTFLCNIIRISVWVHASAVYLMLLTFCHTHLSISVNTVLILLPKFVYGGAGQRPNTAVLSAQNKAHPSLAKLRDGLANGTIDYGDIPIAEMDPEDIKSELKRVYTQLRMMKIKNIYENNPHISKRKGGKKSGSSGRNNRRLSMPLHCRQNKEGHSSSFRVEEETTSMMKTSEGDEELSSGQSTPDLTVQSSPHNMLWSRAVLPVTKRLQLNSDTSFRV